MKHYMQFNLPEEQQELSEAMNGTKYRTILQSLDNDLRRFVKDNKKGSYYMVRALLYQKCAEYGIEIWE